MSPVPVGFSCSQWMRASIAPFASAKLALDYMALIKEELGTHWLQPHLFRFGASSLLTDIERQLEHTLTGHYAADYRMPMV